MSSTRNRTKKLHSVTLSDEVWDYLLELAREHQSDSRSQAITILAMKAKKEAGKEKR